MNFVDKKNLEKNLKIFKFYNFNNIKKQNIRPKEFNKQLTYEIENDEFIYNLIIILKNKLDNLDIYSISSFKKENYSNLKEIFQKELIDFGTIKKWEIKD